MCFHRKTAILPSDLCARGSFLVLFNSNFAFSKKNSSIESGPRVSVSSGTSGESWAPAAALNWFAAGRSGVKRSLQSEKKDYGSICALR